MYGLSDYLKKYLHISMDLFNNNVCPRPHIDFASLHITMERLRHLFSIVTGASARLLKSLISHVFIS